MARTPERITLRPLTFTDTITPGSTVYKRRDHAGQPFYDATVVADVTTLDVTKSGSRVPVGSITRGEPVGQVLSVTSRNDRGGEATHMLYSSAEAFDAVFPDRDGKKASSRDRALRRRDGNYLAETAAPTHPRAFDALLTPIWGAEVNLRVTVEDGDVDTIADQLSALLSEHMPGLRVARAQARTVFDLRVNVSEAVWGDGDRPTEMLRGVNVLDADVVEFMREAPHGSISTADVPYGAGTDIVIG